MSAREDALDCLRGVEQLPSDLPETTMGAICAVAYAALAVAEAVETAGVAYAGRTVPAELGEARLPIHRGVPRLDPVLRAAVYVLGEWDRLEDVRLHPEGSRLGESMDVLKAALGGREPPPLVTAATLDVALLALERAVAKDEGGALAASAELQALRARLP